MMAMNAAGIMMSCSKCDEGGTVALPIDGKKSEMLRLEHKAPILHDLTAARSG